MSVTAPDSVIEGNNAVINFTFTPTPAEPFEITVVIGAKYNIVAAHNGSHTIPIPSSGIASLTIPTINDDIVYNDTIMIHIPDHDTIHWSASYLSIIPVLDNLASTHDYQMNAHAMTLTEPGAPIGKESFEVRAMVSTSSPIRTIFINGHQYDLIDDINEPRGRRKPTRLDFWDNW